MALIRPFEPGDWPGVWAMLEPVFRAGETYAVPTDISEDEACRLWAQLPEATFVALDDNGHYLATYFMKTNHPGPGSHVCNCGYIVAESARGRGVAGELCRHSLDEARERGYRAMQYNLVVANNTPAIRVWEKHGFHIAGTLPGAFHHPWEGYVDAHVMFQTLAP